MFTNVSMTFTGAIITLVETILRLSGMEFPEGSVSASVNGVVTAVGLLWMIWGQMRRKDLKFGVMRKN